MAETSYKNPKQPVSREFSEADYVDSDMYEGFGLDASAAYQKRLWDARALVEPRLAQDQYKQARLTDLLNYSGLAGGQTNFFGDPYSYMSPNTKFSSDPEFFKSMEGRNAGATVGYRNPDEIGINPFLAGQDNRYWTDFLAHEGFHQPYMRNLNRRVMETEGVKPRNASVAWEPAFSVPFYNDYKKEGRAPGSPLYGFAPGPHMESEAISYLTGLEGSLRQGQTLLDHPTTRELFRKHPGMYEEYLKAKAKLRSIK